MIAIEIPKNVKIIINELRKNGYEAYIVGGCVRDAILDKEPNDWDITTSAMPEDVKRLFNRTIDTGIQHGTVTVMIDKTGYEITTYRIDGEYEDGRHPKEVIFTRNLYEDLKRRDFTINAMAYNDEDGLVDEFNGIGDLDNKIIRCVGNPEDRFNEDALRILRAVRFAANLGFDIDEKTREAALKLSSNLKKISKERIQTELDKLIMSDNPEMLETACELGITDVVLKEIDRLKSEKVLDEVLALTKNMEKNHYLRWTSLFVYSSREKTKTILSGLKFDNKTINICSRIVGALSRKLPETRAEIRKDIFETGNEIYDVYVRFLKGYLMSECSKGTGKCGDREYIDFLQREYEDIKKNNECTSLKGLAINGKDLMDAGIEKGSTIGETLNRLLYAVMEKPELNNRKDLLNLLN